VEKTLEGSAELDCTSHVLGYGSQAASKTAGQGSIP